MHRIEAWDTSVDAQAALRPHDALLLQDEHVLDDVRRDVLDVKLRPQRRGLLANLACRQLLGSYCCRLLDLEFLVNPRSSRFVRGQTRLQKFRQILREASSAKTPARNQQARLMSVSLKTRNQQKRHRVVPDFVSVALIRRFCILIREHESLNG